MGWMEEKKCKKFRGQYKVGNTSSLGIMASLYEKAGHEVKGFDDMYLNQEIAKSQKRIQDLSGIKRTAAEEKELGDLKNKINRLSNLRKTDIEREES